MTQFRVLGRCGTSQGFTKTNNHACSLTSRVNSSHQLTYPACFWTVGGNCSTQRETLVHFPHRNGQQL